MDDFYSRTGERYSVASPETEPAWIQWVGGVSIGIMIAVALFLSL
jgi:hypothetical protein